MKFINIFFILLFYPLIVMGKSQDNLWSLLTTQDLKAMHEAIATNDPATVGLATQGFNQWYNPGFNKALQMAAEVTSYGGYIATLTLYANGFYSEHLNVEPLLNPTQVSWPGFIVAQRNGEYKVVYRQDGQNDLPAINAKLLNCDQTSPDKLMMRILPFTNIGYQRVKTTWAYYAPRLFVDAGNPWYVRAKQCVFQYNKRKQIFLLHWQSISSVRFNQIASISAFGPSPDFTIRPFGNNSIWISIPTFQPGLENHKNDKIYDALIRIANTAITFRNKNIIVFDLRGNSGGNSTYSRAILHNLYGDDFIASLGKAHIWNQPWTAILRVSDKNIQQYQKLGMKDIAKKMRLAAMQGKATLPIVISSPIKKRPVGPVKNPVNAKIFLLTDGYCGSDCWLFVREFLQMPNVEQVGQPTHFMTRYTMANPILLPSGMTRMNVPMQVYVTPLDHFDEPFIPYCVYPGFMGDTPEIEKWIVMLASHGKNCK